MMEERRRSPRVRAYRPVRLLHSPAPQVVETLTKDLAAGGVRCVSPTVFPISTELTVELALSTGDEPLTVRGQLVWFRTIPHSEQFDLGIAFRDMPQQHIRRLSGYLANISRQTATVQV